MKRYALFCYGAFPNGGWNDFVGTFDSESEALVEVTRRCPDSYDVVDLLIGVAVLWTNQEINVRVITQATILTMQSSAREATKDGVHGPCVSSTRRCAGVACLRVRTLSRPLEDLLTTIGWLI